jgi:hypothetical protein
MIGRNRVTRKLKVGTCYQVDGVVVMFIDGISGVERDRQDGSNILCWTDKVV